MEILIQHSVYARYKNFLFFEFVVNFIKCVSDTKRICVCTLQRLLTIFLVGCKYILSWLSYRLLAVCCKSKKRLGLTSLLTAMSAMKHGIGLIIIWEDKKLGCNDSIFAVSCFKTQGFHFPRNRRWMAFCHCRKSWCTSPIWAPKVRIWLHFLYFLAAELFAGGKSHQSPAKDLEDPCLVRLEFVTTILLTE